MKCPRCQHENPAGQKFCGDCGARLAASCPACGAANPPGQKFCGDCGAALSPGSARQVATPDAYTPMSVDVRKRGNLNRSTCRGALS
jgi:predicted nucleic acid-binding Zn ribbon protein